MSEFCTKCGVDVVRAEGASGCPRCGFDTVVSEYLKAFQRGTQGMDAISTGSCPGCAECMEIDGHDDVTHHRDAWATGDLPSGGQHFSCHPCGICGTTLGGDRHAWHWVDPNDPAREIEHESDACTDCVVFLANGDEPESWKAR